MGGTSSDQTIAAYDSQAMAFIQDSQCICLIALARVGSESSFVATQFSLLIRAIFYPIPPVYRQMTCNSSRSIN